MAAKCDVVIVGAGVIGLTIALVLSKDESVSVTVVGKHMPGDMDLHYASPNAGANYMPMFSQDCKFEEETWPWLNKLASSTPEAGVHFQVDCRLYRRSEDMAKAGPLTPLFHPKPWFARLLPNYHDLPASSVPEGYVSVSHFTSVCINPSLHLPWLVGQCLSQGVIVRRANIAHILDARLLSAHNPNTPVKIVINATGLSSSSLGGVMDAKLKAGRGQTVLVRNELIDNTMIATSGTEDAPDELCYMMMRAAGGGTILGGSYQMDNWSGEIDEALGERIIKRALAMSEGLRGKGVSVEDAKVDVIRHGVGLRPYREGGPRIEKEYIRRGDDEGCWVVHNYGHGGAGYQSGYGSASMAVDLVQEARRELGRTRHQLGRL